MKSHVPTRWPFILTLSAVASFIAANLLIAHESRVIDQYSLSIATNGVPSIQRLSEARATLRHLESTTGMTFNAVIGGKPFDRSFFAEDDRALHSQLSAYLALPTYPGERDLFREADQSLDAFERAVDRSLVLLERGDMELAREEMRTQTHPLATRAEEALGALIDVNAAQITSMSERIMTVRQHVAVLSYFLYALAGAVALVLMALSVRAVRDFGRLSEERRRLAETRAWELEQFAGRIAHDLKNPLGVIALRIGLAQRHANEETYQALSRQVESMNGMIDDLLGFALSGGSPEPGRTELGEVLDELVPSFAEDARLAGAQLEVLPPPRTALAVSRGSLTSVMSNLLRNAVKYIVYSHDERHITVRAEERASGVVHVDVCDTGPGLPRGSEQVVFDPFVRIAATRATPGSGLGLATVKRIIEAYGGRVGVESEPGHGSRFWFELPKAPPLAAETTPSAPAHVH